MLLIFEGVQGSGKTTIISLLQKKLKDYNMDFHVYNDRCQWKNLDNPVAIKEHIKAKAYAILHFSKHMNVIVDRYVLTEKVYAPFYRGYSIDDYYYDLLDELTKQEHLIVMLSGDVFTFTERANNRHDRKPVSINENEIMFSRMQFEANEMLNIDNLEVRIIDMSTTSPKEAVAIIEDDLHLKGVIYD